MLHVAALAIYLAWVHGGTRVDHLDGVPWLSLAIMEMLLLCPPIRKGESYGDALRRVRRGLARDPLFYIGLALCGLLTIQWANGGEGVRLDPSRTRWIYDLPPLPWAPSSVVSSESRQQLFWFPPVWAALLAVRHGLLRGGQRRLLRILAWNGALLSVFGFIQNLSGTRSLFWITPLEGYFFSSFGYPNLAGAFFTLLFAVSVGLWFQDATDPDERRGSGWLLVPVALNFAGAMGSLSRAAMLLTLVLLVVGGTYCLRVAWHQLGLAGRIKVLGMGTLSVLTVIGLFFAFPQSNLRAELANIQPSTFYHDTIGMRIFQFRSAKDMIKDHPVFGVGGWGYRHFVNEYVTPEEYKEMVSGKGRANVHNDILQFFAEHGSVGFGLMLAAVGVLLAPIWRGVRQVVRKPAESEWTAPSRTPVLARVPPVVWCVWAGTTATVIHSLIDLPFRSPAILLVWTLCLACTPAFLPRSDGVPIGRLDGEAVGRSGSRPVGL